MEVPTDLKLILTGLQAGRLSGNESRRLVFICRGIADSALRTYHRRVAELLATHGWSMYDLSWDCIGELFASESEGKFIKFDSLLQNLQGPLIQISDVQLFLAVKGFVNSFVSYRLKKLLNEADPEGRRISRNIREAVRNRKSPLRLGTDFRGEILHCNRGVADERLPEFPREELEARIFAKISIAGSMVAILEKIANVLSSQTRYRRSVRLIELVQIIKKMYTTVFFHEEPENEAVLQINLTSQRDFEDLRESTIRFVAQKINTSYYQKNKIGKSEARGLLLTAASLLDEWLKGNSTDHNYYKYTVGQLACSEEEYNERWASIIHYIVKLMRGYIREQLGDELT